MAAFFEAHLTHDLADYPDGIVIPFDKPYRWTSADLVRKCKFTLQKHFGLRKLKVGHAGTLDPLATGLLLVCIGKATKLAEAKVFLQGKFAFAHEVGGSPAVGFVQREDDPVGIIRQVVREVRFEEGRHAFSDGAAVKHKVFCRCGAGVFHLQTGFRARS